MTVDERSIEIMRQSIFIVQEDLINELLLEKQDDKRLKILYQIDALKKVKTKLIYDIQATINDK